MAIHIKTLNIASYRGIVSLSIEGLSDINIVVGDNNCGKASFMEAIQILSSPYDFSNIVMVARQRDRFQLMSSRHSQSQYSSFLNIFSKPDNQVNLRMSIGCELQDRLFNLTLEGEIKKALLDPQEVSQIRNTRDMKNIPIDEEVDTFFGKLYIETSCCKCDQHAGSEASAVSINKYNKIMRTNGHPELYPVQFISSVEHVMVDRLKAILRSKKLTAQTIGLLQQSIDPQIQDIRMLEEDDGRTYQAIDHAVLGYMPVSTYGDGIRKTLTLAGTAAMLNGGILLVDEYETALSSRAMSQVFDFLIKICAERNLQLFLTTHSIEAVEKLLRCSNNVDSLRVITLYKNADNTTARVLSGSKALIAKNELGLELRR